MKKTVSAAIGKRNFIIDETAYNTLGTYLDNFKAEVVRKDGSSSVNEVMDELEMRIADLFTEKLKGREVIDDEIVCSVIGQLGLPDGASASFAGGSNSATGNNSTADSNTTSGNSYDGDGYRSAPHKFFRDQDNNMLGGVCSGLGLYLNIDVVLIRILFLVALFAGTAGFWIYIIFCIVAPSARTAAEKCELRGIPANADNIRKFSGRNK